MMLILLISAIVFALLILISIINGWFSLLALWISCVFALVALGGLAVVIIKPRFPKWWEQNIAADIP